MILVELLNLTFEQELAAGGTQMSNSLHWNAKEALCLSCIRFCRDDVDDMGAPVIPLKTPVQSSGLRIEWPSKSLHSAL